MPEHPLYIKLSSRYGKSFVKRCFRSVSARISVRRRVFTMDRVSIRKLVSTLPPHRRRKKNLSRDVQQVCHDLYYVITGVQSSRTVKHRKYVIKLQNGLKIARRLRLERAIAAYKNHPEPTFTAMKFKSFVRTAVSSINKFCGKKIGFIHVYVGHYASDIGGFTGESMRKESMASSSRRGRGTPSIVRDNGSFVTYKYLLSKVGPENLQVVPIYTGVNSLNCDTIERQVQERYKHLKPEQRLYRICGAGSCKGRRSAETPFPYYCALLICRLSMRDAGVRPG